MNSSKNINKNEMNKKSSTMRLIAYMKPYAHWVIFALLLVLGLTSFDLYRPMLVGDAIDTFGANGDYDVIIATAIKYAVVLALSFVFNIAQTWILQKTGQNIILQIRKDLYRHIQSLGSRYFDITPVGKLVTRVTNDVEALNEMYSGILVQLFRNIVKIVGLAGVMLVLDVRLAAISFVLMPLVIGLTVLCQKIARNIYRLYRTRLTDINTFLSEHLSGMKIIQIFGRQERKFEEFHDKNTKLYKAFYREMLMYAVFRPLIYILSILSLMIVLWFGSRNVFDEIISVGTLYIFSNYIRSFFDPIQELAEQFSTLQSSIASAEKIFTVMDEEEFIPEIENPKQPDKITGKIEFDHVWFAYDGKNYVLKDVSFVINPGEKVAFVGATGAGKSSILNLIGRYYDIQKGHIYIDGIDIRQLSKKQLRSAIGQMQQDVFIFEGDVAYNIRLNDDAITDAQVKAAAEYVNASHFIEKLPQGYHEPVTERGATFSAGERQLLSFARTLAHNPSILVMDEATANIDTETEILIQEALEKLMDGRTTIMVAHRLSTIQHADCIMVMHKGRICERGTHRELLEQDGIYRKLYELQIS
ncbi:ABC transporter ATP-binding protein [Agathobacter rectalis]|jgi:ATP-binding cassette subfamily B multidrug efflux pump|uniref:ABC transporter ATP-binding protein n=1 Tax=Agathobacter rectalis TaxID=39491 RepID=A0A413Q3G4_9FIRM|nr:ABC transporter ATP-binding protein [Agathobacter rectalis]HAX67587.1 ABC transporter ATP-binding protein [Eubacterium sp.]RGT10912.1 ABC transporter ATP-binding protein [Agathobacter rectalis]RGT19543.1 ABC transporter ATP-binding protein [Agathobacter rectalis]RGZ88282.1 ABC transporter ATP-binding protein [Agathobacter rectalis]RHE32936.1 ABC transporter ATP-binding protein [Agathobacter rectalis]